MGKVNGEGRFSVCAILALGLANCTSNVQMANAEGQKVQCRTVSFGLLGTLMAASMQQTCIDDYQKQGFHDVTARASPPSPASTGQVKQQ